MVKKRKRRGKLIRNSKTLTTPSDFYRVIGIVDGGEELQNYGVYTKLALAQQVALSKRNDIRHMTCFVYSSDNRIVYSTEGKE